MYLYDVGFTGISDEERVKAVDEQIRKRLTETGIDLDTTLERFCNNENMLLSFLRQFDQEESINVMRRTHTLQDTEFRNATHALKGLSGNLGMTRLYEITSQMMQEIRKEDACDKELLEQLYQRAYQEYQRLCEALANL